MNPIHMSPEVIDWLLEADPAVVYQTKRDLLGISPHKLETERKAMLQTGWVKLLLDRQDPQGTWGQGFYGPKFISTHYTLMLLRRLEAPQNSRISKGCAQLVKIESIGKITDPF